MPPQLHFPIAAGGEQAATGTEGERFNKIAMGGAGFLVEAGLEKLGIGERARELPGRHVIDKNLIRLAARGDLPVTRQRYCRDWIQAVRQLLPDNPTLATHLP